MNDLKSLNMTDHAEKGAELVILHPTTGEPLTGDEEGSVWKIRLIGSDAKVVKDAKHAVLNKRISQSVASGKLRARANDLEKDGIDVLVRCTQSWENIVEGGQVVPFTPDNARRLYRDYDWLREQVESFISDRSNFLGNS